MPDILPFTTIILGLTLANLIIRLGGLYLGAALPQHGPWAQGLKALPGTLMTALVTLQLMQGGPQEWVAGAVALGVAMLTRSLPLTMLAGIAAIYLLRSMV